MPRTTYHRRGSDLKLYILIFLACGALALLVQVLFEAPEKIQEYADERIDSAVRSAVKDEIKEVTSK